MFEVRYKKNNEWFPLETKLHTEIAHGEGLLDPSFVLGVGITLKPGDIPEDADEVYVFYHFEDGEDPEEESDD